jgi:CheY-like chemotaxis protein
MIGRAAVRRADLRGPFRKGDAIMPRQPLILVVASDGLTRRTTVSGLQRYDYEVLSACDGDEAAALLHEHGRRLSVLVADADVKAGAVDGLEVARIARTLNPKVSVIYTSRVPHTIPASRQVNGAPVLRTPYFPQQIVGIVANLRHGAIAASSDIAA